MIVNSLGKLDGVSATGNSAVSDNADEEHGCGGFMCLKGRFAVAAVTGSTVSDCTASQSGGGIATTNDAASLTISSTDFVNCEAAVFGGAVFVDGNTKTEIYGASFESDYVAYEVEDVCLTLEVTTIYQAGWYGAELHIFKEADYVGDQVYGCAEECSDGIGGLFSCDHQDTNYGTADNFCDRGGTSLIGVCDCGGCKCSGDWPPNSLASFFTSYGPPGGDQADDLVETYEICLPTTVGDSRFVFLLTDDGAPDGQSASLPPYIFDARPHSTITFDTAELETKTGCRVPGGADLFLGGGADATVNHTTFQGGTAMNGNGGAVQVHSEGTTDPEKMTKALFDTCQFLEPSADYLGTAVYTSQSQVGRGVGRGEWPSFGVAWLIRKLRRRPLVWWLFLCDGAGLALSHGPNGVACRRT